MTPEHSAESETKHTGGKRIRRKRGLETAAASEDPAKGSGSEGESGQAPIEIEYQCIEHVQTGEKEKRKEEEALEILRRHIYLAMGSSLIPIPVADKLAVSAVQINLLREISDTYKTPFSEAGVVKVIAALATGLGSMELAKIIATSGIKTIPFVGHVLSAVTYPTLCGALTYALGKVFIMHYELGGTLLTLNAEAARNYFAHQFHEGKLVVAQFQHAPVTSN
jgi:uncharacterized protein (DUF697 family)